MYNEFPCFFIIQGDIMGILSCCSGYVNSFPLTMTPTEECTETTFLVEAIVFITFSANSHTVVLGVPFIFLQVCDLCNCNNLQDTFITYSGTINCLASNINNDSFIVTADICNVYNLEQKADIFVPIFGLCVPRPCESQGQALEPLEPKQIDCLHVSLVCDSKFVSKEVDAIIDFPNLPLDPSTTTCSKPLARNINFWGKSEAGLRQLINEDYVSLDKFVEEVLLKIVGPGGRSPFLQSFFPADLFVPTLNIKKIYKTYVDLFTKPPDNQAVNDLTLQLFAVYLNAVATQQALLPRSYICLEENAAYSLTSLFDVDISSCTYKTSKFPETVQSILNKIETILGACCAGKNLPCSLNDQQLAALTNILKKINRSELLIFIK